MESKSQKFMLYVVKPGDTMESICLNFHISKQIVEQFNPLVKNRILFPGQPLNLLIEDLSTTKNVEIEIPIREEKNIVENNLPRGLFEQAAFYLKEAIDAKIFNSEKFAVLRNRLDDIYLKILTLYHKIISPEIANRIQTFISNLHDAWFDLVDKIVGKRYSVLDLLKNEIRTIISGLSSTIKELKTNLDDPEIIRYLKEINELWQTFVLKLVQLKFKEAEDVFQQALKKYRELEELSLAKVGPETKTPFTPEVIEQLEEQYGVNEENKTK